MKNALDEDDFRAIIIELARCRQAKEPFNLAVARFEYWKGPASNTPAERRAAPNMRFPKAGICVICFDTTRPYSPYCPVCGRIIDMGHDKPGKVAAMQAAFDRAKKAFFCYLTGLKVDLTDRMSPCYITFDHRIPKQKGTLRVAVAFVNLMKMDLSEDEFLLVVNELARHFLTGALYNRNVIKFTYWKKGGRVAKIGI
jgi:hypothetical protein